MQMSDASTPQNGMGLLGVLGIALLLLLAVLLLFSHTALNLPQQAVQATATPLTQCPTTSGGAPVFIVRLSRTAYPYSTHHIDDARLHGQPWVLTLDRPGANQRRDAATRNFPRVAGQQPDEYPPAIAREGGAGADVRNIPSGDNQGAGASVGNQLRGQADGTLFCIEVTP
jgi:hypothetical protein